MKKIDPALKFLLLLAVTLILSWKYSLTLNLIVFCACVLTLLICRTPIKRLLILFAPIFFAAFGMFFIGYRFSADSGMPVNDAVFLLSSSALVNGLTQASRVLAYAGVGFLFALTTDRILLVKSFRRRFHLPQLFAYGLLAAWGIFPQIALEFKRTRSAFRARGRSGFPLSPAVLKPMLVKAVRWSEALSVAIESRGFSGKALRSEFEPALLHSHDAVCTALIVGFCILVAMLG